MNVSNIQELATIELQIALSDPTTASWLPSEIDCQKILNLVLAKLAHTAVAECTVRVVDKQESAQLNSDYRNKTGPTNVLSFPFEMPSEMPASVLAELSHDMPQLLGDIVICEPVVVAEAEAQNKPITAHWHHLLVHGFLHLLGFDHQTEQEAQAMEALEIQILQQLGFADPYQSIDP
jgi:probable rRNA maturation factor